MSRWNLAWLISVPMLVLLGLTLSFGAPDKHPDRNYRQIKQIVDVLAEIDEHYVRELSDEDRKKLVEDMINGGLQRLDPYSAYMNAEDYRQFETQYDGKFGGIGILMSIDPKTNHLTVVSPIVGTPAYEAGVQAGDIILKINDVPAEGMKMSEAMKLIMGEPGTKVSLTVLQEGEDKSKTFEIPRANIEVDTVFGWKRDADNPKRWEWLVAENIGYIRLNSFNDRSRGEMVNAIKAVEQAGARGLILDLRGNPGGMLVAATEICDLFLTEGKIVSTRDRHGQGRTYEAKAEGTMFEPARTHPIVVLINRDSASASEIVAAALQDHQRALIIGERSFGKGSVQKIIKLSDDPITALKLTTEKYWRPNGKNIHRDVNSKKTDDWGVVPDLEVELSDEERLAYLRHTRNKDIIANKNGKPKPKDGKDEKPFQDRALEKALDHLRTQLNNG